MNTEARPMHRDIVSGRRISQWENNSLWSHCKAPFHPAGTLEGKRLH